MSATAEVAPAPPNDWVPGPQSHHPAMQLDLAAFCGPLDLLLLLIRRHQLDVFAIPMDLVCRRYLAALDQMDAANLDVGAEFVVLAAELVAIKAKIMVPRPPSGDPELADGADEEDPRAALVARLLEHQKYRRAAGELAGRLLLGRDVFAAAGVGGRGAGVEPARLKPARVVQLAQAFSALLRRQQAQAQHEVVVETVSLHDRMDALTARLAGCEAVSFAACLPASGARLDMVVTFLALLEMTRLRLCGLWEDDGGALWVRATFASHDEARGALQAAVADFR